MFMLSARRKKASPAAQVVAAHLEGLMIQNRSKGGNTRLPPIRTLAKELGVGISTVQAVYKEFSSQGLIRSITGNGSYLICKTEKNSYRVAVNLYNDSVDSPWYRDILGELTMASIREGKQITLIPMGEIRGDRNLARKMENIDVALLMPTYDLPSIAEALARIGIPAVHVNPPVSGPTFNFVSPDYFGACRKIGAVFRDTGRRRLLFLSAFTLHQSASAGLRLTGLMTGSRFSNDDDFHFAVEYCNGTSEEHGRRAFLLYLERGGAMPDAVFASSDYLALGCLRELQARGIRCPEEVSVVGGTGLNLSNSFQSGLTRCGQSFRELGSELFWMIQKLTADPETPLPGRVIPMIWMGGLTTTDEENRLLFAAS